MLCKTRPQTNKVIDPFTGRGAALHSMQLSFATVRLTRFALYWNVVRPRHPFASFVVSRHRLAALRTLLGQERSFTIIAEGLFYSFAKVARTNFRAWRHRVTSERTIAPHMSIHVFKRASRASLDRPYTLTSNRRRGSVASSGNRRPCAPLFSLVCRPRCDAVGFQCGNNRGTIRER